jgi:hypothetical protein
MSHDVHSCTHWLRPLNPPPNPTAFGLVYEGAIDERRHLFVTPCTTLSPTSSHLPLPAPPPSLPCGSIVSTHMTITNSTYLFFNIKIQFSCDLSVSKSSTPPRPGAGVKAMTGTYFTLSYTQPFIYRSMLLIYYSTQFIIDVLL